MVGVSLGTLFSYASQVRLKLPPGNLCSGPVLSALLICFPSNLAVRVNAMIQRERI